VLHTVSTCTSVRVLTTIGYCDTLQLSCIEKVVHHPTASCIVLPPRDPTLQRTGYLSDRSEWARYDATELMSNITPEAKNAFDDILIDVGTADNFLSGDQLLPEVRTLYCV
jgi:hypothetical protein